MAQGSVGAAAWRVAAAAEAATLAAATVVEVGCADSTHAGAFNIFIIYTWTNAVHAGGYQGRGGGRGGGDSFASRGGGDRGRGRGGH